MDGVTVRVVEEEIEAHMSSNMYQNAIGMVKHEDTRKTLQQRSSTGCCRRCDPHIHIFQKRCSR